MDQLIKETAKEQVEKIQEEKIQLERYQGQPSRKDFKKAYNFKIRNNILKGLDSKYIVDGIVAKDARFKSYLNQLGINQRDGLDVHNAKLEVQKRNADKINEFRFDKYCKSIRDFFTEERADQIINKYKLT